MAFLDLVATPGQQVAYLFPEISRTNINQVGPPPNAKPGSTTIDVGGVLSDVFVFQFWPSQVQDNYEVNYATKQIPGGSHPLYQWVGGNGRTISFDATFVSEVAEDDLAPTLPFNRRIELQAAGISEASRVLRGVATGVAAAFLPSSRYTVDVASAIHALQRFLYGNYNDIAALKGIAQPPQKLVLVLPGTRLGRRPGADGILCILLRADATIESWFPNGQIRAATVSLQFAEVVQVADGEGSNIRFIGASEFTDSADNYLVQGGRGFDRITI